MQSSTPRSKASSREISGAYSKRFFALSMQKYLVIQLRRTLVLERGGSPSPTAQKTHSSTVAITSPKGNGGEHSSPTNPKLALTTKSYSIPAYSDFVVIPKISSPGYFLISINRIMTKQKRVRIVTACHRSYGKNGNRRSKGWKVVSKFRTKRETSTHRSRARISQIFQ